MDVTPVWVIFLLELNIPLVVLSVVLLRFPERHLQKRYEFIFMTVMATWLLSSRAIHAVTWPCWATPKNVVEWPLWLVNCDLSEAAFFAANSGELVFYTGLILLLALRILRTRGLDRRIYVPVHIASIVGALTVAALAVSNLAFSSSDAPRSWKPLPGTRRVYCHSCHTCDALSGQYWAPVATAENRWNGRRDQSSQNAGRLFRRRCDEH